MNSRFVTAIIATGLLTIAVSGCSSSANTTADQLVGTWTGTNAGYEGTDPVYVNKPLPVVVQEATGQAFLGYKEWTEPDGTAVDELITGAVTGAGQVTIVDEDGVFEGVLSGSSLSGTYVENGDDRAVLEVELTKGE